MKSSSPPPGFPYNWCSASGEDKFGTWLEFTIKDAVQRLRWMAPGRFLMGSPEYEHFHKEFYETRHEVQLSRGFWIADIACSQELWQSVMGTNPSKHADSKRPVENISWNDCSVFFHEIHRIISDLSLSLPTEAQWEYACRAGTTTPFSFGEDITPNQVNYNGEYPYYGEEKELYRRQTVEIRSLSPNEWGLYEMHGNVWEWCADWFGKFTSDKAVDPAGPAEGAYRVLRGGSAFSSAADCRSASRSRFSPEVKYNRNGFRFVWNLPETGTLNEQHESKEQEWSAVDEQKQKTGVPLKIEMKKRAGKQ